MGRRWGPPFASVTQVSPLCGMIREASGSHLPGSGQGWAAELGAQDPGPWFWQPFMPEKKKKFIWVGSSGPRLRSE